MTRNRIRDGDILRVPVPAHFTVLQRRSFDRQLTAKLRQQLALDLRVVLVDAGEPMTVVEPQQAA